MKPKPRPTQAEIDALLEPLPGMDELADQVERDQAEKEMGP